MMKEEKAYPLGARRKEVVVMMTLKKVLKRTWAVFLAMLAGISLPLLIWVAIIIVFRQMYLEWRAIRAGLLAGNLTCSLTADCPPGYQCLQGKCLPVASQ